MKKLLIVVALIGVGMSTSFAQAQVALGLKGGLNLAKVDDADASNIAAVNIGAFGLIKLAKFGIQPEILFSQQGSEFNNVDFKTSYVNIPVMFKTYLVAGINVQAGPQFGFLNKAEIDGDNVKDLVKKSDVSLNLGLGWDLPFGLMIDARYNLGLTDINDGSLGSESIKNRVIQICVGYKFIKLGK